MKKFIIFFTSLIFIQVNLFQMATASSSDTILQLQASMQMHIHKHSVDGALIDFDVTDGSTRKVYPVNTHPMVMIIGDDLYALCVDVRDESGKSMPIDFYLLDNGNQFTVIDTQIDNRAPLKLLVNK